MVSEPVLRLDDPGFPLKAGMTKRKTGELEVENGEFRNNSGPKDLTSYRRNDLPHKAHA